MTIGAYQDTDSFAYPGWRLTVPGGPAGGHYKGFTHTQAAGTTILPQDDYELDRGDGMSSHDEVHASRRNPRGVYRSSAEVPPRPNASGAAQTYRSLQTRRHAGTSVAPGSFPADFHETGEDDFLSLATNAPHFLNPLDATQLFGLGYIHPVIDGPMMMDAPTSEMIRVGPMNYGSIAPVPAPSPIISRPYTVTQPPAPAPATPVVPPPPSTGATNTVAQPPGTLSPAPPAPSVPVVTAPPISPAPAPTVATNQVVPLNDGSGNYLNISNGTVIPASQVAQNPATGQLTAAPAAPSTISSALSWLEQNTIWSAIPNWGVIAAAAVGASLLLGRRKR